MKKHLPQHYTSNPKIKRRSFAFFRVLSRLQIRNPQSAIRN